MPPPTANLGSSGDADNVVVFMGDARVAREIDIVHIHNRIIAVWCSHTFELAIVDTIHRNLLHDGVTSGYRPKKGCEEDGGSHSDSDGGDTDSLAATDVYARSAKRIFDGVVAETDVRQTSEDPSCRSQVRRSSSSSSGHLTFRFRPGKMKYIDHGQMISKY